MRVVTLAMLLIVSAFAQGQSACGPKGVSFIVKQKPSQHTVEQPERGKALIYFIQETGPGSCLFGACVTKVALDGAWVGAFKHNSYFFVSVSPGEHHACFNVQSPSPLGEVMAFAHVAAEPGKVYYLRMRAFATASKLHLNIDPIDSDQAKYLIASSPLSMSRPRN